MKAKNRKNIRFLSLIVAVFIALIILGFHDLNRNRYATIDGNICHMSYTIIDDDGVSHEVPVDVSMSDLPTWVSIVIDDEPMGFFRFWQADGELRFVIFPVSLEHAAAAGTVPVRGR